MGNFLCANSCSPAVVAWFITIIGRNIFHYYVCICIILKTIYVNWNEYIFCGIIALKYNFSIDILPPRSASLMSLEQHVFVSCEKQAATFRVVILVGKPLVVEHPIKRSFNLIFNTGNKQRSCPHVIVTVAFSTNHFAATRNRSNHQGWWKQKEQKR